MIKQIKQKANKANKQEPKNVHAVSCKAYAYKAQKKPVQNKHQQQPVTEQSNDPTEFFQARKNQTTTSTTVNCTKKLTKSKYPCNQNHGTRCNTSLVTHAKAACQKKIHAQSMQNQENEYPIASDSRCAEPHTRELTSCTQNGSKKNKSQVRHCHYKKGTKAGSPDVMERLAGPKC